MSASRTKQRRIDRLQDAVEKICESDRRFFERHPDRNHRLRLAGQAEVAMLEHVHGGRFIIGPGLTFYAIVKQLSPGVRLRRLVPNDPGIDVDVCEAEARQIYDFFAPPGSMTAKAEAHTHRLVKRMGAAN